jgi:hypothetical protein
VNLPCRAGQEQDSRKRRHDLQGQQHRRLATAARQTTAHRHFRETGKLEEEDV